MNILLVHHTAFHFEALLAFAANLREAHKIKIWSNARDQLMRTELLASLRLDLHKAGDTYDVAVIITGDVAGSYNGIDPDLDNVLADTKVLTVIHQYHGTDYPSCVYVFPTAKRPFIMATTGLARFRSVISCPSEADEVHFLVQGHVDPRRRSYGQVASFAAISRRIIVDIVGGGMPDDCVTGSHIRHHLRLNEISFHEKCSSADYILALNSPNEHPQYFSHTFSSSVLIGLAYDLPFIAHRRLFELYPIVGFAYDDDASMLEAIGAATELGRADFTSLIEEARLKRELTLRTNLRNFSEIVSST